MSKHLNTKHRPLLAIAALLAISAANVVLAQSTPVGGQARISGGPVMTFTQTTISCNGLPSGDSIVLVGFVIDRAANTIALATPTIAGQTDPNGVFTATVSGGVKPISVWLLLDQTTASYNGSEAEATAHGGLEDVTSSGFRGNEGFELSNAPYQPVRNAPGEVNGIAYSGHAFDQMQNRGIMPSVAENTRAIGTPSPGRGDVVIYYDQTNNVRVFVSGSTGRIVTVMRGSPK